FREADLDTALIEREREALSAGTASPSQALWNAAVAAWLLADSRSMPDLRHPGSPWAARDGFRLIGAARRELTLEAVGVRRKVTVEYHADCWRLGWAAATGSDPGQGAVSVRLAAASGPEDGSLTLLTEGSRRQVFASVHHGPGHSGVAHVSVDGEEVTYRVVDPRDAASTAETADGGLRAPMPGRVVAVMVTPGQRVARGAPLLAMEAMKMEHVILAPADGVVVRVLAPEGGQVAEGAALVEFEPG
ncbi:MAG: 3-methylcrotonyl-CoA carboxylase, partial [Gammaproteobacteria bacterium]|nr:3-methylcrotonyl-CoA carboxylase [Gammaproteobacteria bacterium]